MPKDPPTQFEVVCTHSQRPESDRPPVRFALFRRNDITGPLEFGAPATWPAHWKTYRPEFAEEGWVIPHGDDSWSFDCPTCGLNSRLSAPDLGYIAMMLMNRGLRTLDIATNPDQWKLLIPAECVEWHSTPQTPLKLTDSRGEAYVLYRHPKRGSLR